jgi:hypothetical protein
VTAYRVGDSATSQRRHRSGHHDRVRHRATARRVPITHLILTMSKGEKRMYVAIALSFLALFLVLAIGHMPAGG